VDGENVSVVNCCGRRPRTTSFRVPGGDRHRDGSPHTPSDQHERTEPHRVGEVDEGLRVRVDRRQALDAARAPVAREVERHDAVLLGRCRELPLPHARIAPRGMDEQEEPPAVERGRDVG